MKQDAPVEIGHKGKEKLNDMEERKHLQRRLKEQVLDRAAADPQWRQRFIEDPETATAEFPEVQRYRETYETEAPPDTLPTQKEELKAAKPDLLGEGAG